MLKLGTHVHINPDHIVMVDSGASIGGEPVTLITLSTGATIHLSHGATEETDLAAYINTVSINPPNSRMAKQAQKLTADAEAAQQPAEAA